MTLPGTHRRTRWRGTRGPGRTVPARKLAAVTDGLRCPLHEDTLHYQQLIAADASLTALDRLRDANPFPAVSRRLCLGTCHGACILGSDDDPREVDELFDFLHAERWPRELRSHAETGLDRTPDVVIVGGGLAGLAAAVGLVRRGHGVTVLERRAEAGGVLSWAIPEFVLPQELLRLELDAVEAEGVAIHHGVTVGADVAVDELRERYRAVVLASGADLGVAFKGAIDHLTFLAGGGRPVEGLAVEVRGAGVVAANVARAAAARGARRVVLATPEGESDHRPLPSAFSEARRSGVQIRWRSLGAGGCDLVVDCWHRQPDLGYLGRCAADGASAVIVDPSSGATVLPGLFAAGEVVSGPSTAVETIASGIRAARGVDAFLHRPAA